MSIVNFHITYFVFYFTFSQDEVKSSNDIKYELKIHVAFEIIDISIEMKNQLKLGRVQDLNCANDRVLKFISVYFESNVFP